MIAADHRKGLEAILGPGGLLADPAEIEGYGRAARYGGGRPAAVARPRTTEEASRIVAHCVRHGIAFVPQSANTGLVLGSTPDPSGEQLVISLERMTDELAIDPCDRTVRASAGVRLSALNAALEPHGLFLPIDLAADPMLGGMAATNTGGARFLRYGDMRRHVLGLEVVLPDRTGTVLTLGSGLRKDNAVLPLRQLFVGSCGTLGIITRVTLEVHRRPAAAAAALLVPKPGTVMELLEAVEVAAGETLTAFEGMSRGAMCRALTHAPGLRNPFPDGAVPDYAVLVELTRSAAPLERAPTLDDDLEAMLASIASRPGSPLADALVGPADRLWALRHALSEGLRASGAVLGFDLSFRRSRLFAFRDRAIAQLAHDFPDYEVCDFGHIADGGVHFNVVGRTPGKPVSVQEEAAIRDRVLGLAVGEFGASFSGEHGLGRANQDAYDRFVAPEVKAFSTALASIFAETAPATVRLGPVNQKPGGAAC